MASRRCPHCKVESSYGRGGEKNPFNQQGHFIRFDRCTNADCQYNVAVVFDGEGNEIEVFPSLEEEPDELLPSEVRIAFRQALQSLNEKIWDGCVLMCRRALEEATAVLGEELSDEEKKVYGKKFLYKRIEYLAEQHKITPDLRDWAHEGRMAGKLGAHGGKQKKWNSERDAAEIVEFAKWFFRYVFILPRQLAQRREEAEQVSDQATQPNERADAGSEEAPAPTPEAQ